MYKFSYLLTYLLTHTNLTHQFFRTIRSLLDKETKEITKIILE